MDNSGNGKNFELDNFNLNTNETAWEAPERNVQSLGNKIVSAQNSASSPELGQVVDLALPPNYSLSPDGQPMSEGTPLPQSMTPEQAARAPQTDSASQIAPAAQSSQVSQAAQSYADVKTANRLNSAGVSAVSQAIQKLGQDGNVADFYEEARSLMERNLDSSYDRKIGGDTK